MMGTPVDMPQEPEGPGDACDPTCSFWPTGPLAAQGSLTAAVARSAGLCLPAPSLDCSLRLEGTAAVLLEQ